MTREQDLLRRVRSGPTNASLLYAISSMGLPQGALVAGAVVQAVWNGLQRRPVDAGVKDYDIFYYDPDLSEAAEKAVQAELRALYPYLTLDIRNQARVHLWYEARFGVPCAPIASVLDGIGRFPVACTCVGISGDGSVLAPYGLEALYVGRLAANPACPDPTAFAAKAASYRERWPWLRLEGGQASSSSESQ